jgi:predicted O-methyltransferase YrrM
MAVRRILRSVSIRARRRLADLSPAEAARARKDQEALQARIPGLENFDEIAERVDSLFAPYHADYCARVGHPNHAASVELLSFMLVLAKLTQPKRIVDLGSGLTSYSLRRLSAEISDGGGPLVDALGGWDGPAPRITSVDDNEEWLEKTRGYLDEQGVTTDDLFYWPDFSASGVAGQFDLVLHDMGMMDTRARTLVEVVGLSRAGGVVVLDDMHKTDYRAGALKDMEAGGVPTLSAKAFTRDDLTRFAYVSFPG